MTQKILLTCALVFSLSLITVSADDCVPYKTCIYTHPNFNVATAQAWECAYDHPGAVWPAYFDYEYTYTLVPCGSVWCYRVIIFVYLCNP